MEFDANYGSSEALLTNISMKNFGHQSNYESMKIVENYLLGITLSKNYQEFKQKPCFKTTMTWINVVIRKNNFKN